MRLPSLLISFCFVPFLTATPLNSASPQSLVQPLLLETSPLLPLNHSLPTNLTAGATEVGCFKPSKNWPQTRKEDCESVLDYWVKGEDLSLPRIWSRTSYASSRHRLVHLPLEVRDGSCRLWINVQQEGDEEVLSFADVYANVMGPDGLAKTCLGQLLPKALGGRMQLGARGLLSVSLSGVSIKGTGEGVVAEE